MSDISILSEGLNLSESQIAQLIANINSYQSAKLLETDLAVAQTKTGMRLTAKGLDLIAKAVAGSQLQFTKVLLGDSIRNGQIVTPTDEEIVNFTGLINARWKKLPLADVRFAGNGVCLVKCQLNNASVSGGFFAREIGLYATDPDTGNEVLYAYKNNGALATYIPGGDSATSMNVIISLVTVVDQATNVTAVVDASLLATTQAEFLEHINSTKPHPNVPNSAAEISSSNYFWAAGADNQLHPISKDNLSTQILGSNLYELPRMESRIAQTEINLSNLFMQLSSMSESNPEANLLLAEDFSDCACCDMLKIKVDDQVAGADNVCVENIENILEGHWYTISDGVKSQYVQVKSVAKNDSLYVVFFTQTLAYTFNLKKAYLYRSTGIKSGNSMAGAGDIRESTFNFPLVWTGESASREQTLALTTTQKNVKNLEVSGDYAFTSAGEFTLG